MGECTHSWGVVWSESESHSVLDSWQPYGFMYSPWNSPGQNTGVGSLSLLWGIFPTQGLNPDLMHCRQILYQLSHKGSPLIWVCIAKILPKKYVAVEHLYVPRMGRLFNYNLTNTWATLIDSSVGKESSWNAGDPGSIPGLGRSPREGKGYPLLYSWVSLVTYNRMV